MQPALSPDAEKTLLNCFVLDDAACSRGVVESRAKADSIVSVRVATNAQKKREVLVIADWIVKGHNGVGMRRTCEECTDVLLRQTVEDVMGELAKSSPALTGRVKITSKPPGIDVVLDNQPAGTTPLEHDVTAGPHTIALVRDGHTGPTRKVIVVAGELAELQLAPPIVDAPAPAHRSKLPYAVIGLGAATLATGAVFVAIGGPTGDHKTYRDLRTPGYGILAGGGAIVVTGVILMLRGGSSAPTVALTSGGVSLGWAGTL
jgi:hypothetical protein